MSTGEERIEGRQGMASACANLVITLQRDFRLLTVTLDGGVFAQKEVLDQLQRVGAKDPKARFRIMVHPEIRPQRSTLPLLELSRKLSSCMTFRQLPETMRNEKRDLLLVDSHSALLRADPEARQSILHRERARIRNLQREFDGLWEHCQPAAEFRSLVL